MSSSVWVAGVGLISSIGNDVTACIESLTKSRSGIGPHSYLQTIHSFPVGEVKLSNHQLEEISGFQKGTTRTALLSLIAAREAIADSGVDNIHSLRTGFISANSVGGMDKSESYFGDYLSGNGSKGLGRIVNHECGKVTELVADQLGIVDHISTVSTACSSSANSLLLAARMIKNNLLDVAIAGGVDALTGFTLNGFNTLMILDPDPCKPFDENRKGLNLGEGAGYLVLVSDQVMDKLNKQPYAKLSGYSNANDAFHQTASSPDGTGSFLAMQGALQKSNLLPDDIGYINLHGTGTANNDISEGTAIKRIFSSVYPKMSSTKAYTGHTLGASGGIEAVFSVLSLKHGFIYPNLRLTTPIKELPFIPETILTVDLSLQHVMSNSFGFGGNCTTLIFSKS